MPIGANRDGEFWHKNILPIGTGNFGTKMPIGTGNFGTKIF